MMEPGAWTELAPARGEDPPSMGEAYAIPPTDGSNSVLQTIVVGAIVLLAVYHLVVQPQLQRLTSAEDDSPEEARRKRLERLERLEGMQQLEPLQQHEQTAATNNAKKNIGNEKTLHPSFSSAVQAATPKNSESKLVVLSPTNTPDARKDTINDQQQEDDLQILQPQRPVPTSNHNSKQASTKDEASTRKPTPSSLEQEKAPLSPKLETPESESSPLAAPAEPSDVPPSPHTTPASTTRTTGSATPQRKSSVYRHNNNYKTPRDIVLQALSSITDMAVRTEPYATPTKTKKTSGTTTGVVMVVLLPGASLSETITWNQLQEQWQVNSTELFAPLSAHITTTTPASVPTNSNNKRLQPKRLAKASTWYDRSKRWMRDEGSFLETTNDNTNGSTTNQAKEAMQAVLDQFQRWVVETLVKQLVIDAAEFAKNGSSSALVTEDDDDGEEEMDLGLFADESYGAGRTVTTPATPTAANQNDDQTLWGEIFVVLGDASLASKILNKPFLGHVILEYNKRNNSQLGSKRLEMLLLQECLGRLPSPEHKAALDCEATQTQINAVVHLLTLSPDASKALASTVLPEEKIPTDGKSWEEQSHLRSLLYLAAFTVPRFHNNSSQQQPTLPFLSLLPHSYHASMVAAMGPEYPVCLYAREGYDKSIQAYHGTTNQSRNILRAARTAGALACKKMAATSPHPELRKGGVLFDWIGHILETNEALVDMLQSDLLSPDTAQALCACRPFLLGITSSLLQMCSADLSIRLTEKGWDAFDCRYFAKEGTSHEKKTGVVIPLQERCLIESKNDNKTKDALDRPSRFAGATEFFFLTAALLRVSLFPGFRVNEEFQSMLRGTFTAIQQLSEQQPSLEELEGMRGDTIEQMQKSMSVTQGWNTYVNDPDVSRMVTIFSLMQLQWVAQAKPNALSSIPEWFVKLPSQWLAHVAMHTPQLFQPHQGEAAVRYATQILQAGTKHSSNAVKQTFSPPVLCQLIRIAGAFVREGVRRARQREKNKAHRRGRRGFKTQSQNQRQQDDDFDIDIIDDRTLDIYRSFDARDLGVTVFTNDFVAKHLCLTLMRAYMAMDAVEGMDVEREHHFEKFEVKHEVADLLLRLWCHPNRQSRDMIVNDLDEVVMNEFCSSIGGALGFQLDQACQFILDIRDIKAAHEQSFVNWRSRGGEIPPLSRRDKAAIEHHSKFLSFSLSQCRRLLLILCSFSEEDQIATVLGGKQSASKHHIGKSAASDLASMFLNLMERITDEDGGIHPELEKQQLAAGERSKDILARLGSTAPFQLQKDLEYFLHSRRFALLEYGLDVALLSHQFLALAARWHLAAATGDKEGKRTSKFLEAVVASDICDPKRLRNVFNRLVGAPKEMFGSERDNAAYILQRDGHVDLTIWKEAYNFEGSGPDKGRGRKITAKQDRMSYAYLDSVVEMNAISAFLDDLEEAAANKQVVAVAANWGSTAMERLEEDFFTLGDLLNDEDYTSTLKEWVVSSDSFLAKAGNGSFVHSYDAIVRGRSDGGMGAGKILAKEARKCFRLIPAPHPNTSVFVCFAEERTDLCKALIIGAADTPFSMGMFEFDILFPSNFPQSPPLFNFKTTGDGRTRISSNLYNDGKVCISILGTYQAFDDSQRWNPSTSSLAQVLASLQTQLLGDVEPYFSDGFGHDTVRGTPAGDRGSQRFNNKIRLHTLRYAIIAPLKYPPLGFDEVVKRHFVLCRKRVLVQARLWTTEAKGTPLYKSFIQAYEELATLLSSDDLVRHKAPGQTEERVWGSVPLPTGEFRLLQQRDPAFVQLHQRALKACVEKKKEDASLVDSSNVVLQDQAAMNNISTGGSTEQAQSANTPTSFDLEAYNPWAQGSVGAGAAVPSSPQQGADNGQDEDDLDDMYD